MKRSTVLLLAVLMTTSAFAADGGPQNGTEAKPHHSARAKAKKKDLAEEIEEMKAMLQQQQQQIDELKSQLAQRNQAVNEAQQQAAAAQTAANDAAGKADNARVATSENSEAVNVLKGDVSELKAKSAATEVSVQQDRKKVNEALESPLSLHYKGITITPGGFLAAETVTHQRAMASDVDTPFNSIPFNASGAGHTADFYGTGRQSRLTFLMEGKLSSFKLSGYYEMDWLSAGVTSNSNSSNSYTNRQRQLWAQVATNSGLKITAGQMWSLVTETKKGMDNRTEALPMSIDAQYVVGFAWARQYGFRVTQNFSNKFWLGMAVENAQVNAVSGSNLPSNFFVGSAGNSGGLYNSTANYSFNSMPDLIFKAVAEPTGNTHFELVGVLSRFRDRIYPNAGATPPSATGAYNNSKMVGGIGVNARAYFAHKKVEVALKGFGGQGVGRYSTSGLPDLTVHPDGTLAPLHAYAGVAEIDFHLKKWDWYFDAGQDYVARAFYPNSAGTLVGYGVPTANNTGCISEGVAGVGPFTPPGTGACAGNTRNIIEGTFGFWYKVYAGPKGKLQFGPQYEHIVRNTWRGNGGDPSADNNILLTSFRYYLP